ncbi:uncharacterized protein [Coffea arabica]|uniref:DUF4283 domain-containing protein n=1 Tax=Coffea arabica TaxID=13443 RepID=A0ABM4W8L4_COFAR
MASGTRGRGGGLGRSLEREQEHEPDQVATAIQRMADLLERMADQQVEKFTRNRPRIEDIRKFFLSLDLKDSFSVGLLDSRHVLIRLHTEEDFLRVWTRAVWYVAGNTMRVVKWTPAFLVDKESALAPVWFSLPKLPTLFIDAAMAALCCPSVARVCEEVDLLKELLSRVWLQLDEDHGFWQLLQPEFMPKYCAHCYHQGHTQSECHVKHPELRSNGMRGEKTTLSSANNSPPRDGNLVELRGSAAAQVSHGDELRKTDGYHVDEEQDVSMQDEVTRDAGRIIMDLAEQVVSEAVDREGEDRDVPPGFGDHVALDEEEVGGVLARAASEPIVCASGLSPQVVEEQLGEGEEGRSVALTLNLDQIAVLEQLAVVGVCEPKLCRHDADSIRLLLNFDSVICNSTGELWVFFNSPWMSDSASGMDCYRISPGRAHGFSGSSFTWCNNRLGRARIWKQLDRVLLNMECLNFSFSVSVSHLVRAPSDHAPVLLSFVSKVDCRSRSFRFLNVWPSKEGFLDVVRTTWQVEVSRSSFSVVWGKLRSVSRALHLWNKQVFGDVFENVKKRKAVVAAAKVRAQSDLSDEAHLELQRAQANLKRLLAVEEQFWSQKARVKWLQHGDRNSRYFHSVVKQCRFQSKIHKIQDSARDWVMDDEGIGREEVRYFSNLFTADPMSEFQLLHVIPNLGDDIENMRLEEVPSLEEVKAVIFDMDGDSAAGPDGFTGKFFMTAWEMVAHDVYKAIVSFFCGAELPRFITATSIVLLPKVMNPKDFTQFRPISMSNFLNKVISRLLVGRLSGVLPRIIYSQQSGFVKGRSIADNYLLAQELISEMGRKCKRGNLALKLDMAKAYDRTRVVGYKVPRHCPSVSHLAFADDVIIFANGGADSLRRVMRILDWYQSDFGQLVNVQKSRYLVHPQIMVARKMLIELVTQFYKREFPVRYLGAPLFIGRAKEEYYSELC